MCVCVCVFGKKTFSTDYIQILVRLLADRGNGSVYRTGCVSVSVSVCDVRILWPVLFQL